MTDKEKIEAIIREKQLNNTQFCNEVCIAPGTLSHIRNGRTEPTLNILRSIAQAFPDINPAWLYYDEGPMFRTENASPHRDSEVMSGGGGVGEGSGMKSAVVNDSDALPDDGMLSLFGFPQTSVSDSPSVVAQVGSAVATASMPKGRRSAPQNGVDSMPSVSEIVAETLRQQARPVRKVIEVRIFFDDGTFETFSSR